MARKHMPMITISAEDLGQFESLLASATLTVDGISKKLAHIVPVLILNAADQSVAASEVARCVSMALTAHEPMMTVLRELSFALDPHRAALAAALK